VGICRVHFTTLPVSEICTVSGWVNGELEENLEGSYLGVIVVIFWNYVEGLRQTLMSV